MEIIDNNLSHVDIALNVILSISETARSFDVRWWIFTRQFLWLFFRILCVAHTVLFGAVALPPY